MRLARLRRRRGPPGPPSPRPRRAPAPARAGARYPPRALAVASPPPGDGPRIGAVGIALALLQTLPLAFRRWRPVCVLAMVVAATLGTAIAATRGTAIAGDAHVAGPVCVLVALYSVAAYCPLREAAWAGIAAGAVLAWPLRLDSNGNTLG